MKRAFGLLFIIFSLTINAQAADFLCKTLPGARIETIAASLNATVVDSLPEPGLYRLSASVVPSYTPAGAEFIETPSAATLPKQAFSIISKTTTGATAAWYRQQPAMQVVNLEAALAISQGSRVIIADINSAVDFGHP